MPLYLAVSNPQLMSCQVCTKLLLALPRPYLCTSFYGDISLEARSQNKIFSVLTPFATIWSMLVHCTCIDWIMRLISFYETRVKSGFYESFLHKMLTVGMLLAFIVVVVEVFCSID